MKIRKILPLMYLMLLILSGCQKAGNQDYSSVRLKNNASCGEKEEITLAFLYQDLENEWWISSHQAITTALSERGIRVIERNSHGDSERQLAQAKEIAALGVDGVLMIAQDGVSAVHISSYLNEKKIPVGVFGLPPSSKESNAIVVLPEEYANAKRLMTYLTDLARRRYEATQEKAVPILIIGDLKDPNAVNRRRAFKDVYDENRDIFHDLVEVPSKWDAATCLANLESAVAANPEVDFIFTSSDFFYPQIRAVLESIGKWEPIGDPNHVIMGGVDGDLTAGRLMDQGIVDATAVHDLNGMADAIVDRLITSIIEGEGTPEYWMHIEGFTLTQENLDERRMEMWGNILREQLN
jgi:ABC-type sugar transport system substrate-binding protein